MMMNLFPFSFSSHLCSSYPIEFKKAMDRFLRALQHCRGSVKIEECRRFEQRRLVPKRCRWTRRNRLKKTRSRRWMSASNCTWTCWKQSRTRSVANSRVDRWVMKNLVCFQKASESLNNFFSLSLVSNKSMRITKTRCTLRLSEYLASRLTDIIVCFTLLLRRSPRLLSCRWLCRKLKDSKLRTQMVRLRQRQFIECFIGRNPCFCCYRDFVSVFEKKTKKYSLHIVEIPCYLCTASFFTFRPNVCSRTAWRREQANKLPDFSFHSRLPRLRFREIIIPLLFMVRIIVGSTQRERKYRSSRSPYLRASMKALRSEKFVFLSKIIESFSRVRWGTLEAHAE